MSEQKTVLVTGASPGIGQATARLLAQEGFAVFTTRGRPVAVLAPFEAAATPLERLEASGRALPAEGDLLELGPPPRLGGRSLSRALREQRGERL
jgi:NAD(P)-dependent dehydrogenase (short-subunit alcohol dehydrogenase family)